MKTKDFDLRGKDYLTREEAAHYACVSLRKWDTIRKVRQIPRIPWGGKTVYRRADIQRAIESCPPLEEGESRGISAGRKRQGPRPLRRVPRA